MVAAGAPLRIAFFGTPAFAVPALRALLASRHEVVVAVTQPDRARGRGQHVSAPAVKAEAIEASVPVSQPDRVRGEAFLAGLSARRVDLGVVAAYGRILPQELIDLPRLGMINVHASLLPKYRGAAPVQRAIMAGESETGVTIMRVVLELDAGPMLSSRAVSIGIDETSVDIEHRLAREGAALLVDAVEALAAGTAVELPQDDAQATHAPRITRDDGRIEWTRAARQVHDQVRALHPWPHACAFVEGARLVLLRTALVEGPVGGNTTPGTILEAAGDRLIVACGRGTQLQVLTLQREGRKPLAAREFLAGSALHAGVRLTAEP